ncbi:MAG: [protein-PII] uridylyltransferase [Thiohalomonadales bacterium]
MINDLELFNSVKIDNNLLDLKHPLKVFTSSLKNANTILDERFLAGRTANELIHSRAAVIDYLLTNVWKFFIQEDLHCCLVAVGGYGRSELHPHSDIDIMIIVRHIKKIPKDAIEKFITFLWDMHLNVGHSVRTPSECASEAKKDITIATNMQESRLLIGEQELFDKQKKLCSPKKLWNSKDFFNAKWDEQKARYAKYNDTAYNLEPNVKEGPGGLRDIQTITWVTKRHFGSDNPQQLVNIGFLTMQELDTLITGQSFLWKVRYGLHLLANRREDRLLFDFQRELATQFGYQNDKNKLAVEYFMKDYYRTIMELNRLNEMLLQLFQEEILFKKNHIKTIKLNSRFNILNGFIEIANNKVFINYPFALLEIFLIQAQHPELNGVRANTIRVIRENLYLIDANFRNDLRNKILFMEILRQRAGVTHELRRMNTYGILAAYIPEFNEIVGQMQHDLFHVYTVDQHILFVIRNIRRYTVKEFSNEFPLCSNIIKNLAKQEILILAGIFHDISKGQGGDHSTLGSKVALEFCQKHNLNKYDSELVEWLVLNHLKMSITAQKKDIYDIDVIKEFANLVGDQYRLDLIFLLTVSDIRATSPKVWNSWKYALLSSLYTATKLYLKEETQGERNQITSVTSIKEDLLALPEVLSGTHDKLLEHWNNLSNEYFIQCEYSEIVWQSELIINNKNKNTPIINIHQASKLSGTIVFIYATNKPGLLSLITAVFEQLNINVVNARIYKTNDNFVLASFIILEENGNQILDINRIGNLNINLNKYLNSDLSTSIEVNRNVPRQLKHFSFPTEVIFSEDKNKRHTIMEVIAFDQPGMLSRICSAMDICGVELISARIATYGERVNDIFYITNVNEKTLPNKKTMLCLEKSIIEVLSD